MELWGRVPVEFGMEATSVGHSNNGIYIVRILLGTFLVDCR